MRSLVRLLIILGALTALGFIGYQVMRHQTKKASPEGTSDYVLGDLEIHVFYNRPYKKDRVIFGGLVPYGQVWRTGANEATTFNTNQDLRIEGQVLPAGKYTLWTIPNEKEWQVIFNKKMYSWGVGFDAAPAREPSEDALQVTVPVQTLPEPVEQFTIAIQDTAGLVFTWDRTRVAVKL